MWDPALYNRFASERSRPFFDLVSRIGSEQPDVVVDLGCGTGELTATLARRWPGARVHGLDSSPEMISAAKSVLDQLGDHSRLSFAVGDVSDWRPDRPVDVIVSNAVLQWVPDHEQLLVRWAEQLAPGGWLAFQVPANFDQPSHRVLRELAAGPKWRAELAEVKLNRQAANPEQYLDLLAKAGLAVDAWETTYCHVLHGDDPVVRWYRGTGLRPVLTALPPDRADDFLADYAALIHAAYPATDYGTMFPFRRVFVVANRTA